MNTFSEIWAPFLLWNSPVFVKPMTCFETRSRVHIIKKVKISNSGQIWFSDFKIIQPCIYQHPTHIVSQIEAPIFQTKKLYIFLKCFKKWSPVYTCKNVFNLKFWSNLVFIFQNNSSLHSSTFYECDFSKGNSHFQTIFVLFCFVLFFCQDLTSLFFFGGGEGSGSDMLCFVFW